MAYISAKIRSGQGARNAGALAAILSASAGVGGCLTEFPPPLDDSGTVPTKPPDSVERDAQASTGSQSANSSELPLEGGVGQPDAGDSTHQTGAQTDNSTTGTSVDPTSSPDAEAPIECPSGTTECNGACIAGNSCCATSCAVANAVTECRDEQCVIVECVDDFVDCDGRFDNGCEQDMAAEDAPVASVAEPLLLPQFDFSVDIEEIDHRAWQGIARYHLASGCGTCEASSRPPEVPPITPSVNQGKVPGRNDLRANYALAWDETGLWVNVVVVDNQLIGDADVASNDDARKYDNLMVVWEPTRGSSNPGTGDDHIAFIGIDGQVTDWRAADTDDIAVAVKGVGQCRSFHAYFARPYLFGSDGSAPNTFSPGDVHGLVVAYNDFDFEPDTEVVEREHVVFGIDMTFASGTDYFQGERTLPQVQVAEP